MKAFGRKVAAARKAMGLTQIAFAEKIGIGQSFMSSIENGTRKPAAENLLAILDVLALNNPAIQNANTWTSSIVRAKGFKSPGLPERREELVEIPVMADCAAAGAGRVVSDDNVSGVAWIPRDQLGGRDRRTLRAIRVKGRSMEPLIHNGALVVIDCDDREKIDPNAIYAVRDDGEGVTLKHVVRNGEKRLTLVAANPDLKEFPPASVDLRRDQSPIVGRAIWVGQGL